MGGQTSGETMGYHILARVGAGINPDQMHAERVDGFNPLAVIDAIRGRRRSWRKEGVPSYWIPLPTDSGHSPQTPPAIVQRKS